MKEVQNWIKKARKNGKSWEDILMACKSTEEKLIYFLESQVEDNFWPVLSVEDWKKVVIDLQNEENAREQLIDERGATIIGGDNEDNEIKIPDDEDSAWQCYRRKLLRDGFSKNTIDIMEDATLKTLRHLSRDTRNIGTVKGLVVGNVQSGKTANMAALMAMAADNGWNMFVVLSGMMTNLRLQTQKRLWNDLSSVPNNWEWRIIDNPKAAADYGHKLRELKLDIESKHRYIAVCLKNATRLKQFIDWLDYDKPDRKKVRLLIIDDEADQASINTSIDDRTAINRLILNLVNNRDSRNRNITTAIQAINYIGYTATPYANVMNEGPGEESLYPSNFLTSLTTSDQYFGPQQIFGYDDESGDVSKSYSGLDIIRIVSDEDVTDIGDIQEGVSLNIPQSLIDSICWFINGVGYLRSIQYGKPVSMLIHTSRNVCHHNYLADAISGWINSNGTNAIISICEELWNDETRRLTRDSFFSSYPNYGGEVREYPAFDEIKPYIKDLLNKGLTRIMVNSDNNTPEYSNGIHLCIDNSEKDVDSDSIKRLVYPDADNIPDVAPAFIVVGGNTLSRGLTIEGLVSTFFLRPARCADTLMQMGRWFGYRRGYELIPRIWMTAHTKSQFEYMATMDQRLRDEIKEMSAAGISPRECGPKIMNSPSARFLQIVARNRMQDAVTADYDFAGHTMETGVFNNDEQLLNHNLEVTANFLRSLGPKAIDVANNPNSRNNSVWRGISLERIKSFLSEYKYSERLRGFNELEALTKWLDKVTDEGIFGTWNVILAGIRPDSSSRTWEVDSNISTVMVHRTRKYIDGSEGVINIGTLRSFNDFLSDIPVSSASDPYLSHMQSVNHNLTALNKLREKIGLGNTPQLIVYIIDKDSAPEQGSNRHPLNAKCDIAGFSINIPGVRRGRSTVQSIRIRIPQMSDIDEPEV